MYEACCIPSFACIHMLAGSLTLAHNAMHSASYFPSQNKIFCSREMVCGLDHSGSHILCVGEVD